MPTAEVKTLTDRAFLDEMVQIIDGTHWTKGTLACVHVVYDKHKNGSFKKEKVTLKNAGPWSDVRQGYEDLVVNMKVPKIDDNGKVVTKPAACLVGIVLRVQGADWGPSPSSLDVECVERIMRSHAEDNGGEDDDDNVRLSTNATFSESFLSDQGSRICRKLAAMIVKDPENGMKWWESSSGSSYNWPWREITLRSAESPRAPYERIKRETAISLVERWNDDQSTSKANARAIVVAARDAEPQEDAA